MRSYSRDGFRRRRNVPCSSVLSDVMRSAVNAIGVLLQLELGHISEPYHSATVYFSGRRKLSGFLRRSYLITPQNIVLKTCAQVAHFKAFLSQQEHQSTLGRVSRLCASPRLLLFCGEPQKPTSVFRVM